MIIFKSTNPVLFAPWNLQVSDYTTVIKQPMDLSTLLSKIDLHKYHTVKDYVYDVDLIWKNALEYNPDKDPSGEVEFQWKNGSK